MNRAIFYSINTRTEEDANKMQEKFRKLEIPIGICRENCENPEDCKRKALRKFLSTDKEFAVIVDGNLHIHRNLARELQGIILTMKSLELDFLLLGYYTSSEIEPWNPDFFFLTQMGNRRYHLYPSSLRGNLVFVASRTYAEKFLKDKSYLPSKKALVYPMYAIEENSLPITLNSLFSQDCHYCNYFPDQFY